MSPQKDYHDYAGDHTDKAEDICEKEGKLSNPEAPSWVHKPVLSQQEERWWRQEQRGW